MSPIIFSLYINDIEMKFIVNVNVNVSLQEQEFNLFTLMYVDDIVWSAEYVHELQLCG